MIAFNHGRKERTKRRKEEAVELVARSIKRALRMLETLSCPKYGGVCDDEIESIIKRIKIMPSSLAPDPCWVLEGSGNQWLGALKSGIYVFTSRKLAREYMKKVKTDMGTDGFRIRRYAWNDFVAVLPGFHGFAIIDYKGGCLFDYKFVVLQKKDAC